MRYQAKFLFYADALKIFKHITNHDDATDFQHDLDSTGTWCIANKIDLNLNKCHVFRVSRKKELLKFNYCLMDLPLSDEKNIHDLGIWFSSDQSFNYHIGRITAKAYQILGFIIRYGKDFWNLSTLKLLYFALVRSQLEYGSIVWALYQNYLIKTIKHWNIDSWDMRVIV